MRLPNVLYSTSGDKGNKDNIHDTRHAFAAQHCKGPLTNHASPAQRIRQTLRRIGQFAGFFRTYNGLTS